MGWHPSTMGRGKVFRANPVTNLRSHRIERSKLWKPKPICSTHIYLRGEDGHITNALHCYCTSCIIVWSSVKQVTHVGKPSLPDIDLCSFPSLTQVVALRYLSFLSHRAESQSKYNQGWISRKLNMLVECRLLYRPQKLPYVISRSF